MRLKMVIALIILISSMFCSEKNSTKPEVIAPEDLLPKDNEISGWTRTEEFWTARGGAELSSYINGGAALYENYGFVECAAQVYEGAVLEIIEKVRMIIFDQGNSENTSSLFEEYLRQMSSPIEWNEAGTGARIERFPLSQIIVFYRSKYFVSLTITSGSDEALEVLKQFAKNVDSKIK
jgi:hypothetical protein